MTGGCKLWVLAAVLVVLMYQNRVNGGGRNGGGDKRTVDVSESGSASNDNDSDEKDVDSGEDVGAKFRAKHRVLKDGDVNKKKGQVKFESSKDHQNKDAVRRNDYDYDDDDDDEDDDEDDDDDHDGKNKSKKNTKDDNEICRSCEDGDENDVKDDDDDDEFNSACEDDKVESSTSVKIGSNKNGLLQLLRGDTMKFQPSQFDFKKKSNKRLMDKIEKVIQREIHSKSNVPEISITVYIQKAIKKKSPKKKKLMRTKHDELLLNAMQVLLQSLKSI